MQATISLTGYVGTDLDLVKGEKWSFARFRLACTPRQRTRDGQWKDGETTWVTVQASNSLAENVGQSINKGDPVVVTGRLRTHAWSDADGERQDRLVVEASAIGHDLSRGTSAFTKVTRAATVTDSDDEVNDGSDQQSSGEQGETTLRAV